MHVSMDMALGHWGISFIMCYQAGLSAMENTSPAENIHTDTVTFDSLPYQGKRSSILLTASIFDFFKF